MDLNILQLKVSEGKPKNLSRYGFFLYEGIGVEKNYIEAYRLFKQAAKKQDHEGLFYLGEYFYQGIILKKDINKALRYFKRSALLGNSKAMTRIGSMRLKGEGPCKRDLVKALFILIKASEIGNSKAEHLLKTCLNKKPQPKHVKTALELIHEKAESIPKYQLLLGILYAEGNGVTKNEKLSFEITMKAAVAGNTTACRLAGVKYYKGTGVEKNHLKSFQWLTMAAFSGDARCENSLGFSYQNGIGTKQDFNKSLRLFRSSSKKGNTAGINSLGYSYEQGFGVDVNHKKSLKYYQLAGIGENSQAQYNVGYSYKYGVFVVKNQEIAFQWYLKAHFNGFLDATNSLAICYEEGFGIQQDVQKAIDLYIQASPESEHAQYNLGVNYINGTGVKKDYCKAYDWFEKSSNNGHTPSKDNIEGLKKIHFVLTFNPQTSVLTDLIIKEPNPKDKNGNTPLHYLIKYSQVEIKEKLLLFIDSGADFRIVDNTNSTIFELLERNHPDLSKYLKSYITIITDFLNLFERGEFTDCQIKGFKVHTKWLEHRLRTNITHISLILNKYSKKELKIFFEWVYSGIVGDVPIIKEITQKLNIEDYFLVSGRKGLITDLKRLFKNHKTKDFSIIVNGKSLKVHKLVLLARSDLFRGMFLNVKDSTDKVKDYSGKNYSSLSILVKFLYTDNIDTVLLDENAEKDLQDAVDYYQLNEQSMLVVNLKNHHSHKNNTNSLPIKITSKKKNKK
ncbi:sel1-repeat-containing protein ybeq [Anaeramoeba flamelloides]|uniref:Sel1-repeat-containing protein ybeq n=1 Tax=Anaeramoeba flamelloides TaxID=1746091 RepID=A0AAV7Y4P9_9EUKA|nr:sel1-repeat-containing protein ybeq [Anaeramoeba flamelloides]